MNLSASIARLALIPVLAVSARAILPQDETQFGPNDKSRFLLSFSGSYTLRDNEVFDREDLQLLTGLGYFPTRHHEFGTQLIVSYQKSDLDEGGGSKSYAYRFSPYYNYNWQVTPQLDLFLGPHVEVSAIDSGDDSSTNFGYGIQGGARYFLSPNFGVEVQPRFTRRSLDGDFDTENEFAWLFGITIVL